MPNTNALRTSQSLVKDGNDRRSSRNHNPGPLLMSATLPAALSGTNSPASRQQPSTGSPNGLRARRFPAGLSPTTNTNTSNNTNTTVMMHPGSPTGWMVSPTAASNVTGGGALSHKASNDSVADFFGAAGMKEAMMCGAVGADGRGVTVIYPQRLGSEESCVGGFQDAAAARAHDAERANKDLTQVRVEGFFEQNHEVLIPSDLPRSTLLYVLTASDGRDLMFKLMQYTLQLFICLLQTPSLFSPEVQPFAAKWAVRFWRNYNTIRHGRSLFKLGRGLLNFFTLQTALERLWLKHHDYLAPYVAPVEARLEHMAGLLGIRVRPRRATREIGLEGSHSTIALSPLMEAAGRSGFFPDKTAQDEAEADHPMQHDVYSHISKVERNPQMLLRGGPRPARLLPGVAGFPVEAAELDESGGGSSSIHSARPFFVREGGAAARTSAPGSLQSSFAFGTSPPTNSAAGNMLLGGLLPSPTTTVESIQSSFAIGTSPLSGPLGFPSSTSAAAATENQPMHATTTTTTTTHEKDEDAHSVPPRQPTSHLGTARPTPQHSTDEDEDDLMFDAANTDTKTNANTCVRGTTSKSSTPTTAVVVPPSTTQDAQDGAALKLKKPRFLGGASSSTSSSVELSSDSSPHSDPPQHASPNALAQTMPLGTDPQEAVEACEDDAEEVEAVMATRPTTTTTAAAGGVGATPVANEAASRPPLPPLAPLAPTIASTQRVRTNNSSSAPTPRGNNTNNNSSSAPTPVHEFDGSEVSLATSSIASNSESGLFQAKTELQPASDAAPSKWRRGPLHFNTFLMILLCIRSLAAGTRRFMRDAMLISSERFVRFDYVERHRVGIHRRVNRMWLIVAAIDLLLNTLRLGREGWVRYAMARQSTRCRCGCSGAEDGVDAAWRASGFIARRTTELAFPHLDLDYGAPIPSSIMYFEAADPGHMLPACERCGFLYKEVSAFASKHQPEKEKPRWLQLYDREAEEGAAAAAAAVAGGPTPTTTAVDAHGHEVVMLAAGQTRSPTTTLTAVAGTPIGLGDSFGDPSIITGSGVAATTTNGGGHVAHHRENTATAGLLTLPLLMRKVLNYVWLLRVHPNLSATLLLELRCIAELFLAYRYCYGSYESFKPDAPLAAVLHPSGAIAGMVSAAVGLVRVVQSAPV